MTSWLILCEGIFSWPLLACLRRRGFLLAVAYLVRRKYFPGRHWLALELWLVLCEGNIFLAVTGLPWTKKVPFGCSLSCAKEIFSWPLLACLGAMACLVRRRYFPGLYWLAWMKKISSGHVLDF
ncbi:unnamed protein product [Rhizophagus irregularis]|uniref:Uncharacterized protein n=1 Tax=Rhizophagus irregularis TaxID=588596 RepID=A0A2I1GA86_9GLOM|nr:hypothetical protein RhiirA4_418337 [Rhizophagus irregularis]CAB4404242.1 unnamed protein product [Rhizophagus irregularis]